ncbi:MAG: inositol monophosphatase family protein [Pseudomonadota bacterium]
MSISRRSALINVMVRAAEKAGRGLSRDFGEVENLQVSKKGPGDFVSAADIRAEKIIREELAKARPKFGFLMEESGETKGEDPDRRWIVDPLDGTSNFLHGIPRWAVSIAAEEKGKIIAAVVYEPVSGDLYWAERGNGAYLNNRRLECSRRSKLADCMVGTGLPGHGVPHKDIKLFSAEIDAIMHQVSGLRRMGGATLDLCYVASGKFDGFWERNLSPWDLAAGSLIITEAGGVFTDITKGQNNIYQNEALAANGSIHHELRTLILNAGKSSQKEKAVS